MKNKVFVVATIPKFFNFFKGQLSILSNDYDVTIVANDVNSELEKIATEENVLYNNIAIEREISLVKDFKALIALVKVFHKEKPKMIWANTPKAALLSIIAGYLTKVKVRQYMCHGLRYQTEKGFKRLVLILMEKITCKLSTHVVCVSHGLRQQVLDDNLSSADKAQVIGNGSCNGIDTEHYDERNIRESDILLLRKELNIQDKDFIFIFIGRIVKDKGIHELLDAFEKVNMSYPNTKLLVIGGMGMSNKIDDTDCYELTHNINIRYVGPQKDIRPYMKLSNTLVLPSYREGFGMVLLEALSMGLPIIASNIIGCSDILQPEVNGLFCEKRNSTSLKDSMCRILCDEELKNKFAQNARDSIKEKYDCRSVWNKYLEYYKSIIE